MGGSASWAAAAVPRGAGGDAEVLGRPRGGPARTEVDELSIMELRDELEEEGLDEDAIDAKCDALRTKLLEEAAEATPAEAEADPAAAGPTR